MEVCNTFGVRKGLWSAEEDRLLRRCIEKYGEGKWHQVPLRAGLNRCRKSCRLRWLNYLKPDIKRGSFSADEVDLMLRLHRLLGNRWSLIAGRLPGRTSNDVKNYWNTHLRKKTSSPREACSKTQQEVTEVIKVMKPKPHTFSKEFSWLKNNTSTVRNTTIPAGDNLIHMPPPQKAPTPPAEDRNIEEHVHDEVAWWDDMVLDMEMNNAKSLLLFDEHHLRISKTTSGIEAAEDSYFLDSEIRDLVANFNEDSLEMWDLLGDDKQ